MMKKLACSVFAIAAAALLSAGSALAQTRAAPPAPQPKLLVLISIDQFSSDLFGEYRSRFTGGLGKLIREGAVFPNGYQSHAATETCPGHSTLLSGKHPSGTGIIANAWIDAKTGLPVYCVYDPTMTVPNQPEQPRGPSFMKAETLADWMKAKDPGSRVFSVSGKDRAAIAMVGKASDGTFWWDDANGFNTYVPKGATAEARLAPVAKFNKALFESWKASAAAKPAAATKADAPAKAAPAAGAAPAASPDWKLKDKRCAAFNGIHKYGDAVMDQMAPPTFYGREPGVPFAMDTRFFQNFASSPVLDEVTLSLAKTLLADQKLGRGASPDLLAVSLSGVDRIGHRFGTHGPEMCDQLAHLDAALADFIATLQKTGVPFAIALSADHGSVDAAERASERGIPALRVAPDFVWEAVNTSLRETLKLKGDVVRGNGDQGYILQGRDDAGLRAKIETQAVADLKARADVFAVYTRADIKAAASPVGSPVDELSMPQRIAESFDPDRSGDIFVVFKPYASLGVPTRPGDTIAGHGSVWNYDRRVPIIFWRTGGGAFEQPLPIETVDIGPTLAALVNVTPPPVDGRCIDLDPGAATTCPTAPAK